MLSRRHPICVILVLLCCISCKQSEPPVETTADVAKYASLPGLTTTHHKELQAEFARLLAERATPLQLMGGREATPAVTATVSRLDAIFPRELRDSNREQLAKVWPAEQFEFSPATLHVVGTLTQRFRRKREQYEALVSQVDFQLPVDHSRGLLADTSYLDAIEIGHRLAGLHAAESIAAGDPQSAIDPLRTMFRVCELLAREPSMVSRGSGALRRSEALQVVEGIARHAAVTPSIHRQLRLLVEQQLERWPDDAHAWIGDRAQGLHTYELVRGGYLLSLFTDDEIGAYRDEFGIEQLSEFVASNIDPDELFYLRAMRDIVEACGKPHYQRDRVFRQLETDSELLRDQGSYPFVADQLLLSQVQQGSRLMALDRAKCEAWVLALRLSSGDGPLEPTINPLTGDKFYVELTDTQVVVDAVDPERGLGAAIVPRLSQESSVPRVSAPLQRESLH